jgi:HTH-type transcriptional repressor of NAD biosynthesis genes
MVDEFRLNTPISGTKARGDIYGNWRFLPHEVKEHFRRRVAIVGPESTGKTTMVKRLEKMFDMRGVMEYGREYCETHKTSELTPHDFVVIQRRQVEEEEKIHFQSNGIVFCDTDPLTTSIFYDLYVEKGTCVYDPQIDTLLRTNARRPYDLTILLTPEVDHVQDGQRDFGEQAKRWEIFNLFKQRLTESGANFIVVGGNDYADRIAQAAAWVDNMIADLR